MPKIRWLMIWLCFLANAIAYIDRTNIAVAAPAIRAELGIDATAMGLVLSAFFWTYAFMQLPAGWFIDRVGVRVALTLAVGWWSIWTAATGMARGVTQFIGMRLMLGHGAARPFWWARARRPRTPLSPRWRSTGLPAASARSPVRSSTAARQRDRRCRCRW